MGAISRAREAGTTWLQLTVLAAIWACGTRQPPPADAQPATTAPRVLPLARVYVLETSGPAPSDTSVTFTAGTPRTIVLYHSGENIAFARLIFGPDALADTGQAVRVDARPRPGIYGLDVAISLPVRENRASVVFEYARYFSAPLRARQKYGSDVAFERALAVGRLLPDGQIELLPSTRPAADHLQAFLPAPGSYVVAAPQ
ncbi:MAG: hypothetical protein ACREMZ_07560 [Gemmatimonadales bacterium]